MKLIKDYARLILFAAGILIGVQVPNFIDQYAKRISAHYLEAEENFKGYQQTADRHFGGDIGALLEHYTSSPDTVFKDDAGNIKQIHKRRQNFKAESTALNVSLFRKIFHVMFYSNHEVLKETVTEFTYMVPLNHEAILCGLLFGLTLSVVFELAGFMMGKLYAALFGRQTVLMGR